MHIGEIHTSDTDKLHTKPYRESICTQGDTEKLDTSNKHRQNTHKALKVVNIHTRRYRQDKIHTKQ